MWIEALMQATKLLSQLTVSAEPYSSKGTQDIPLPLPVPKVTTTGISTKTPFSILFPQHVLISSCATISAVSVMPCSVMVGMTVETLVMRRNAVRTARTLT